MGSGGDQESMGDRNPLVGLSAGSNNLEIHTGLNDEISHTFSDSNGLALNEFSNIAIQQMEDADTGNYIYSVFVNDQEVYQTTNSNPLTYQDMSVTAGDQYFQGADGIISDFSMQTFAPGSLCATMSCSIHASCQEVTDEILGSSAMCICLPGFSGKNFITAVKPECMGDEYFLIGEVLKSCSTQII